MAELVYERLDKEELFLAHQSPDHNDWRHIEAPGLNDGSPLAAFTETGEHSRPITDPQMRLNRHFLHKAADEFEVDGKAVQLGLFITGLLGENDVRSFDMAAELREYFDKYNDLVWERRQDSAAALGRIGTKREVYVVASEPYGDSDVYAARYIKPVALREGPHHFALEPLIAGRQREGLLPRQFYMYGGLFAPVKQS